MTEQRWSEAAQWAEGLDTLGPDMTVTRGSAESHAEARDLLEGALSGPDVLRAPHGDVQPSDMSPPGSCASP